MNNKEISKYWLNHIKAQKASKLSKTEYSRQNNLAVHQYLYWCLKKEKLDQANKKAKPNFLPITVAGDIQTEQLYCTIEYPQGIRLQVQSKDVLEMLPKLLRKKV